MVKLVGINHVALEVGDIDEALAWYVLLFPPALRAPSARAMAFVDMGDQFLAFARGRSQPPDTDRHFGLVVDDKDALRAELEAAGVQVSHPPSLDFRDPWGNHVQAVDYRDVQFTKAPAILRGMGLELEKSDNAKAELRDKGLTSA
jgi:catechol 2,3-dioxygenase-like lactoylglutathione lyase family enzyme